MGISDGYYNDNSNKTLQRTVNHFNTDKTNYGINLLPLENQLISTSYQNKIPVLQKKGQLASSLINDMPTYENIGFDSPTVKKTQGFLDNLTNLNYDDAFENELNDSAKGGEFGSSYQASRRASLQDSKAKALAGNALTALQTGQSIYSNNLGNAENLMNFYLNADSIPNLGSSMSGGLLSSGGNDNNNLLKNLGIMSLMNSTGTTTGSRKSKNSGISNIVDNSDDGSGLLNLPGNSGTLLDNGTAIPSFSGSSNRSSLSSNNDYSNIYSTAMAYLPEIGTALSGSDILPSLSGLGTGASAIYDILPYLAMYA